MTFHGVLADVINGKVTNSYKNFWYTINAMLKVNVTPFNGRYTLKQIGGTCAELKVSLAWYNIEKEQHGFC